MKFEVQAGPKLHCNTPVVGRDLLEQVFSYGVISVVSAIPSDKLLSSVIVHDSLGCEKSMPHAEPHIVESSVFGVQFRLEGPASRDGGEAREGVRHRVRDTRDVVYLELVLR